MLQKKRILFEKYSKSKLPSKYKDSSENSEHVMFFDIKTDNDTSVNDFVELQLEDFQSDPSMLSHHKKLKGESSDSD